ncbi:hypothetical protein [Haloechinothrix sp. LS1_15]|uniref:hypothetical protein n=1 Tax=Haloechinothrix sp. LS1_15 TaxID=2652248 RepID=UPI002948AA53|nr:hypothetical protein [Haloechinothrix sp. LS1_15]MDV6013709.1 hypothetical protein [Haloechinothrix sp. LS1_15]
MTMAVPVGRRAFLARLGVLGVALGSGALLPRSVLAAAPAGRSLHELVSLVRPVLAELARDTMNGLAVFTCPGPDSYSRAQGTPREEPGAMEAETPDFLLEALDSFVPFPDQIAQPVGAALVTGLSDSEVPLDGLESLPAELRALDEALAAVLVNDATLPLSFPVAGMLNLMATRVNPAAVNGAFHSPFSRLTYEEKAEVFRLIEGPDADLVALLDAEFPQPLRNSVSGLLRFVGGALIEFAHFGAYSEYAVFDTDSRQLTGRPVGWRLTGYQPDGPVEGWDDLIGFYQERTEVSD